MTAPRVTLVGLLVAGFVVVASCGGGGEEADAGVTADGGADAGPIDAGTDAGATDLDAGSDAGAADVDAGEADAGRSDAGTPDAGMADAGGLDAGAPVTCTASGIPGLCVDVSECIETRQPTAGLCPGPANIQCCTPRTAVACDPNAWPQPNAGLVEAPGTGGCPDGMVRVDTFCIDRFEASLEELDGGAFSPFHNPGTRRLRARSLEGAVPQGYLNEVQAAAACAEAGKRLCTDTEWLRACRGPSGFTYPYGNVRMTGTCNDHRAVHPAIELYGTSASWIFSHIDSPCLNQLDAGVAPTGVNDLMGNLHEWTADPAGTFRGGFYVDTVLNGNGCLYVTTAHDVNHWDYSTGFRCCHN
jgi:hypothetical protein